MSATGISKCCIGYSRFKLHPMHQIETKSAGTLPHHAAAIRVSYLIPALGQAARASRKRDAITHYISL